MHKIQQLTRQKNKRGIESLLGLANYFRAIVKYYAEIVEPLVTLAKKNVNFKLSDAEESAFKKIQAEYCRFQPLKPPTSQKKKLYLIKDASKTGISGILSQEHDGI